MNVLIVSKVFQIVISIILVILVVVQSKGTGLSSAFGGSGSFYRSRRGIEKGLFIITIALGVLLVLNSIALLLLG